LKKKNLSVCLVVKNEEKYLTRCLNSIKDIADEIVIIDTGSTDKSLEIARQFTDKVYIIKWHDDFSKARNFALGKATGEWILFLDGDEELTPESIEPLRQRINRTNWEGCLIKVLNRYNSGSGIELAPDVIFRLFRNKKEYRYAGAIHEQICDNILAVNPSSKIDIAEDICLLHYGYMPEEITAKNKSERNTNLLLKAVKKNPDSLLNRFHLGVEYFRSNQLNKALEEFLYVLDKVDLLAVYVPKLMRYITKCHYLSGNLQETLRFIDEVWIKAFKDQGDLYYLRGLTCRDLGRHLDAYYSFKQCLSLPPQPAHYANLYYQYKDKIFLQLGDIAEYYMNRETALEYYIKTLKENPKASQALGKIISILNPRKNPNYTANALNSIFDLSDPGIQLDLGYIFFRETAYELAAQYIDKAAAQMQIPVDAQLIRGLSRLRTKQIPTAVQELDKIPPGCSAYISAQGNLFLYYWINKLYDEAAKCLENIKKSNINSPLAEVLEILFDDQPVTMDDFNNGLQQLYPEVVEILERLIEFGDMDSFNQAWNCFEGLFENRPARLLADLYYKNGFYDMAEIEYRSIIKQASVTPELYYLLGKTYWALKDLANAEKYYREAIDLGHSSPLANWEMARIYQEMAIQTLREGIAEYPDNQEIMGILKEIESNLIEV
jgi:glycosyltransferase involved in cell wall biosynthesis